MVVYIILIFAILCGFSSSKGILNKERSWLLFLIICMLLLCAFRGLECGTDTINYRALFESKTNSRDYEILYGWSLEKIPTFRLWIISYAAVTYLLLYYIIKKEVTFCCIAILIFVISPSRFFPETFNIVRQTIAAVIMLGSFVLWNRGVIIWSLVMLLTASFFHTSSLIALPFLLLSKIEIKQKASLVILIASLILGFSGSYNDTIRHFVMYGSLLSDTGIESLNIVTQHYTHYGDDINTLNFIGIGMRLLPTSLLCLLCCPRSFEEKQKNSFYYNVFLISTAVNNIIIPSMAWGIRLMFSIQLIQVLTVSIAYQYSSPNRKYLFKILLGILLLLFLYYLYSLPTVGVRPIVPYEFSFES